MSLKTLKTLRTLKSLKALKTLKSLKTLLLLSLSMDYWKIIDRYYPEDDALRHILITHSRAVADRALLIARRHPELALDRAFLEEVAMLHDIGVCRTDAAGIECFGTEPYIRHGVIGAEMMRAEGFPRHARVCERHTGTGITRRAIEERSLPLPLQDFLPETLEEQVICYADKFFSKSHLERVRTVSQAAQSLEKFGEEGVRRFLGWAAMFE